MDSSISPISLSSLESSILDMAPAFCADCSFLQIDGLKAGDPMNDLERLKEEYARREKRFADSDLYSLTNPSYRFMKTQLQKNITELLESRGRRLESTRVLEIVSGKGDILMDLH